MRILVNPGESALMVDTRRHSVELKPFSRRQNANVLCFAVIDGTIPKSDLGRGIENNVQRGYLRAADPKEIAGLRACNVYVASSEGFIEPLDRRPFEISDTVSLKYLQERYPKLFPAADKTEKTRGQ